MREFLKWALIIVVGFFVVRWVWREVEGGPVNLGGHPIGRAWAGPLTQVNRTWAWYPRNGIPHIGGAL